MSTLVKTWGTLVALALSLPVGAALSFPTTRSSLPPGTALQQGRQA